MSLSNLYTIGMLNAKIDAQIAAVDRPTLPWNTLDVVSTGNVLSDVNNAIPAQWNYAGIIGGPVQVLLRAAADIRRGLLGLVTANEWFPNEAVKVAGWIAMAGNYILNTHFIDSEF